jgi:hypothetical protein
MAVLFMCRLQFLQCEGFARFRAEAATGAGSTETSTNDRARDNVRMRKITEAR